MAVLLFGDSRIIVQGITGREAVSFVGDAVAYGARIVGGVTPGKGGERVHDIPVYDTVRALREAKGAVDVAVVSVPPTYAQDAAFESIENGIPLLVILTERMPRRDVAEVLELARHHGARVIGPNSLGLISPGKSKAGPIGGPPKDVQRAFQPGPVGILSRSGGMTTEIANLLTAQGLGQSTCISIGGDPIIGSTYDDLLPLFEEDPDTKALVLFGEPGGFLEQELADRLTRKPSRLCLVAFLAGAFLAEMPGRRFGHAGTIVRGPSDTVAEKAALLQRVGVRIAPDLASIPAILKAQL